MRTPRTPWLPCALACAALSACAADGIRGDDGLPVTADAREAGPVVDADPNRPCDMTGTWIAEQHTVSTALGADQNTTLWFYYEITQEGERFTMNTILHCGFIVAGTTSVTITDETLAALAPREFAGAGRQGTFKPAAGGSACEFSLDRSYNVRGAMKSTYLTDVWNVGDPPKPLSEFPELSKVPPGIEDWDMDGKHGFTLKTPLGDRYVAQRDWNEHTGTAPMLASRFGGPSGEHAVIVRWDGQEAVSEQTGIGLRISSTPKGNGWSQWARADDLVLGTGPDAALMTCRNVQRRAREIW